MIAENQTVPVDVLDHEPPETITASLGQRHCEHHASRRELRRQRIRVGNFDVRIPGKRRLSAEVWDRLDRDLLAVDRRTERLEPEGRPTPAHDPEEFILRSWASKDNVEPQHVPIERERRRDVRDDEERRDAGDHGSAIYLRRVAVRRVAPASSTMRSILPESPSKVSLVGLPRRKKRTGVSASSSLIVD